MHLPKSVVLQGPLWAHSCFAFETNLGKLKELVTSAKGVSLQIVERLLMSNSSKKLKALATIKTQKFMSKTKKASCKNAVPQLGKPRELHEPLLGFVKSKLRDIVSDPIVEHDRVEVCGYVFHSEQYSRPHKTDSTALMASSGLFIKIEHIVSFKDTSANVRYFAVCKKFVVTPALMTAHILKAHQLPQKSVVEILPGALPCLYIDFRDKTYFVKVVRKALHISH